MFRIFHVSRRLEFNHSHVTPITKTFHFWLTAAAGRQWNRNDYLRISDDDDDQHNVENNTQEADENQINRRQMVGPGRHQQHRLVVGQDQHRIVSVQVTGQCRQCGHHDAVIETFTAAVVQ